MPRFAANLSMMFNEVPFLERFARARAAGFEAVEYLFPYEYPPVELKRRLDDHGLKQVLFNMPPGDWAAGERGLASLPGRQQEFRDGVARALEYASALSCPLVHAMAGIPGPDVPPDMAAAAYAINIAYAAEHARKAEVKVVLEAINQRDMPGFFLQNQAQAAAIVAVIGSDRVGVQFDVYHCQVTEGDLSKRLERHMPVIGHIQIADVPARHEPWTGEINWDHVFSVIDLLGYKGWVGCEYRPAGQTEAGLGWLARTRG